MSVSISRFVNVMSAGRYGKGWVDKPMTRRDDKVAAILQSIQDAVDKAGMLGVPVDPTWQRQHDDLLRDLINTGGRGGAKLLDYLDDVAKRGQRLLSATEIYAADLAKKVNERRIQIDAAKTAFAQALYHLKDMSPGQHEKDLKAIYAGLQDSFEIVSRSTDYTPSQNDFIKSELNDIIFNLEMMQKSIYSEQSIVDHTKVAKFSEEAQQNPNGDLGKLLESLTLHRFEYGLLKIEGLKQKHGVDFRPLSAAEVLAIYTYTDVAGDYRGMHSLLLKSPQKDTADDKKIRTKIDLCVQAMAKLENYPEAAAPTFRLENGSNYPWQEQFVVGKIFSIKIFWSTGRANGVAASGMNGGPRLDITVFGKTGKDVGKMSSAQGEGGGEILFAPGTKFKTLALDDVELKTPLPDGKMPTVYLIVQEV